MPKRFPGLWLCALTAVFALSFVWGCGDDDDDSGGAADDDETAIDDDAGFSDDDASGPDDDDGWQPVAPHREDRGAWHVVWLAGNAYEMGYQHGELMHDEIAEGMAWLDDMNVIDVVIPVAKALGLWDLALETSFPEYIEECHGMSDAAGDVGMSFEACLLLSFGDVLYSLIENVIPIASDAPTPGCTQALVVGDATLDGRLLHARSMDWDAYPLLIDHPTIFVRQPDDGIPHVIVGFPANISPYQGMNAEGISIASNKIDPANRRQVDWTGRSHAQIQGMILKKARILDEARAFFEAQDEFGTGLSAIGDGPNRTALIYEVTANARTARTLERGVVWQTNHFVSDAMRGKDEEPSNGSMRRYERVEQLVAPNGEVTHYGQIDALTMVNLMRDRVNPWTHEESPKGVFEDGDSIATNGAVYQVVFDPEHLWFWAAGGALPVPEQPFVGFSLAELLGYPDAAPVDPDVFPPL